MSSQFRASTAGTRAYTPYASPTSMPCLLSSSLVRPVTPSEDPRLPAKFMEPKGSGQEARWGWGEPGKEKQSLSNQRQGRGQPPHSPLHYLLLLSQLRSTTSPKAGTSLSPSSSLLLPGRKHVQSASIHSKVIQAMLKSGIRALNKQHLDPGWASGLNPTICAEQIPPLWGRECRVSQT